MDEFNRRLPKNNALEMLKDNSGQIDQLDYFEKLIKKLDRGNSDNRNRIDLS